MVARNEKVKKHIYNSLDIQIKNVNQVDFLNKPNQTI